MKEFPIQGCFKFDGKNQYDLITYLKKNRTSNDIIGIYDNFVGWNSKFYWFCQSSSKIEYKWEELSKFVTKIVSKEEKHEDYTGRTIKALINSPQATRVKLGEEIKILKVIGSNNYVLDENAEGTPGMWITKPLNLEQWELLPEISDVVDMKAIQEKCIIRFPIGCKYLLPDGTPVTILEEDDKTYTIHKNIVYAHIGGGALYRDGKYATLVSLPEEKTIKQNFIVDRWYKYKDWYIKYKETSKGFFIASEQITDDRKYNKFTGSFGKSNHDKILLEDLSEIQAYLPDDHPDKISKSSIPEYVEYIDTIYKGIIVKVLDWSASSYCIVKFSTGMTEQPFKHLVKPSTKEAYDAQFIKQEPIYAYEGDPLPTIKTKPLIEDVQSVSVNLRTKKNNNKFKF